MGDELAFVHFKLYVIEILTYTVHATRITNGNYRFAYVLGQQVQVINAAITIQDKIGLWDARA
jgi:hypothetical protein